MNPDLSGRQPWERAFEKVGKARVTMVIGAADTGKTSLVASLADALNKSGRTCGIVDADMGQSTIGPPTTIGLGGVYSADENLPPIDHKGIYFVGAPSPKGHLLPAVIGTKRMVDKALELGFDHILIDTTGLVHGLLGEVLKGYKVELIQPDLLIVLQRQGECEHLLRRFRILPIPDTIVVSPSEKVRRKSPAERRAFREKALLSYFADSAKRTLNLKQMSLIDSPLFRGHPLSEKERKELFKQLNKEILWAESLGDELHVVIRGFALDGEMRSLKKNGEMHLPLCTFASDEFENMLIGLYDKGGDCYSLGIMKSMDFSNQHAEVEIAEDRDEPRGIKFSRYKMSRNGSGELLLPKRSIRQGP